MPREHEWEYAAKAGTDWTWNYWWGNDWDGTKATADADSESGGTTPLPLGREEAETAHRNPWGFFDILGNVWEWCQDWYRDPYVRDDTTPEFGRVVRGGSWVSFPGEARSACRAGYRSLYRLDFVAFRSARAQQ